MCYLPCTEVRKGIAVDYLGCDALLCLRVYFMFQKMTCIIKNALNIIFIVLTYNIIKKCCIFAIVNIS